MFATVDDFQTHTDKIIDVLRTNHEKILSYDVDKNGFEILHLFAYCDNNYYTMKQQLGFWKYVSTDEKIRKASIKYENILLFYNVDLLTNSRMYSQLVKFFTKNKNNMNDLQTRYLKKVIIDFKRAGADLSSDKIHELRVLEKKLIEFEQQIIVNISNADEAIELDHDDIKGLPEKIKLKLKKNDKYIIPLSYYYYKLCMKNIHSEKIRKIIDHKYNNLCSEENSKLLVRIILLNNRKTQLLNKNSYTDYTFEQFMVSEMKNVLSLFKSITPEIESLYLDEMRALLKIKSEIYRKTIKKIYSWDISYYFNKIETAILGVRTEELNNYFSLNRVIKFSFNMCKYLFNIVFNQTNDKTWNNSDVFVYNVFDEKSNKLMGTIYFDLFDRKHKYKDNICYTVVPYYEQYTDKYVQSPCLVVIMNLCDNKESDGETILISHQEALKFLHLLGSAVHGICGKTEYCRLSGNQIECDLKECWPYVFEKWFWEKNILNQFEHWETKEKIPETLVNKLIKTKTIRNGFKYKKQLAMTKFDITINSCSEFINKLKNVLTGNSNNDFAEAINLLRDIYNIVFKKIYCSKQINISKYSIKLNNKTFMLAHKYDFMSQKSKHFCYIWSEIFADDIFCTRFKNDIFSHDTSKEFKQLVLDVELESFYIERFFVIRDDMLEPNNFLTDKYEKNDDSHSVRDDKKSVQVCDD
jgi:Zn-dependent oligopeptidase